MPNAKITDLTIADLENITSTLSLYYSRYFPGNSKAKKFPYDEYNAKFQISFGQVPTNPSSEHCYYNEKPGFIIFDHTISPDYIEEYQSNDPSKNDFYYNYYIYSTFTLSSNGLLTIKTKNNEKDELCLLLRSTNYFTYFDRLQWEHDAYVCPYDYTDEQTNMTVLDFVDDFFKVRTSFNYFEFTKKLLKSFLETILSEYDLARLSIDGIKSRYEKFINEPLETQYRHIKQYEENYSTIVKNLEKRGKIPELTMQKIHDKLGFESLDDYLLYLRLVLKKKDVIINQYDSIRTHASEMANRLKLYHAINYDER